MGFIVVHWPTGESYVVRSKNRARGPHQLLTTLLFLSYQRADSCNRLRLIKNLHSVGLGRRASRALLCSSLEAGSLRIPQPYKRLQEPRSYKDLQQQSNNSDYKHIIKTPTKNNNQDYKKNNDNQSTTHNRIIRTIIKRQQTTGPTIQHTLCNMQ